MKNLVKEKFGVFSVRGVAQIRPTIDEALELSRKEGRPIKFEFNGVVVTVDSKSNLDKIHKKWLGQRRNWIRASEISQKSTTKPRAH